MRREPPPNLPLTQLLTQTHSHQIIPVEQKVLGFLIDPDWGGPSAVNYVLAYGITPDDFYYTEHQRLFQVLVELTKRNVQFHKDFDLTNPYPSIIHLYDKMFAGAEPLPEATTAGLKQYLLYLQSQVVSHDVFFDQVKLLKQSASDRKLLEALVKVIYHYQQTGEWNGALNQVAQALLPALEVSLERVLPAVHIIPLRPVAVDRYCAVGYACCPHYPLKTPPSPIQWLRFHCLLSTLSP